MVHYKSDDYKHICYTTDLYNNNFENNLDVSIMDINIKKYHIYRCYVYNNIDNRQQNPTLQFLSIIGNIKVSALTLDILTITVIFYCNKSRFILLNN